MSLSCTRAVAYILLCWNDHGKMWVLRCAFRTHRRSRKHANCITGMALTYILDRPTRSKVAGNPLVSVIRPRAPSPDAFTRTEEPRRLLPCLQSFLPVPENTISQSASQPVKSSPLPVRRRSETQRRRKDVQDTGVRVGSNTILNQHFNEHKEIGGSEANGVLTLNDIVQVGREGGIPCESRLCCIQATHT